MPNHTRERLIHSACIASFFSLTLFFFGPAHLYFTNILEYSISSLKLLPFLLALSVISIILLTALLALTKPPIDQKALSALFALAFLLWLQGNLLVWNYGLLDGRDIDWSAKVKFGMIDSAIWVCVLILSFAAARHVQRFSRKASLAFILIQIVSTLFVAYKAPDASHIQEKSVDDDNTLFSFSAERNVLLLLLDGFQGDVFQEILDEGDHFQKMFRGFTYYRNTLGGYPSTYPSIPLILTGRYYDNSIPAGVFLKNAYSTNSVPAILKKSGYQVDLIGGRGIIAGETIASHWVLPAELVEHNVDMRETALLFDVTLFRYLPHFLKIYVYNRQSWLLSNLKLFRTSGEFPAGPLNDSVEIVKKMVRQAEPGNDNFTFKYIYLWPPHFPLRMNERLEYEELPRNRDNFKRQAKGTLELVHLFLRKLEEMGVYDKTMIIIAADHGQNEGWKVGLDTGTAEKSIRKIPMIETLKASALPLLLVKPFNSDSELHVSDAPVSLSDIPKTIISHLGLQAELPGVSVFDVKDSDSRRRRFLYYKSNWAKNLHYLQPMKEYFVLGLAWLDDSWEPSYKIYTSEGVQTAPLETYRYGNLITFGEGGNSLAYQGEGWSYPDEGFTPTDERTASLTIPVMQTSSNLELKATCTPFIVLGKVDKQIVKIMVNGNIIGEWLLSEQKLQEKTVVIPHDYLSGNIVQIAFELPDAISPLTLGIGRDERQLSIAMSSIVLTERGAATVK